MKFSIKNFFSKYDQIHKNLRICSHLPKKSLTEDIIFLCSVDSHMLRDLEWLFDVQLATLEQI